MKVYRLKDKDGNVLSSWDRTFPSVIKLPNGDIVHGMSAPGPIGDFTVEESDEPDNGTAITQEEMIVAMRERFNALQAQHNAFLDQVRAELQATEARIDLRVITSEERLSALEAKVPRTP